MKKNLIILVLVAAVVSLFWLYVAERGYKQSEKQQQRNSLLENGTQQSAQQIYQWRMVTSWPKNFPGLGVGPEVFAKIVNEMSNGRLQVKVFAGGELVPPLGVFDAVSNGSVELGHSGPYYWKGKIPASPFFSAIPFGMTGQEMNAWLHQGGGMELWREAYAPFNLLPLAGGNSGVQMGGWFRKEINSVADLKGLKMRIPGLGGEVLQRLGGVSVTMPGGELYTALQTGVLDAAEWVGPYNDLATGLYEVTKYYYYPGWHEPGSTLELIVNKTAFEKLPPDLKKIIEIAARYVNANMLDEYTASNNAALKTLIDDHNVQLKRFPDEVLRELNKTSDQVIAELVASDPMAKKVYASWKSFADDVKAYHKVSEQAFLEARDLQAAETAQ